MSPKDTIAAIATASGRGAIGIIRVSGPHVRAIAERILGELPRPRFAALKTVRDSTGKNVDQAITIFYPEPNSFTGEDTLEIQTHGGVILAREVLELVIQSGARAASPGEFSERAFLNGKIDLLQAEAIADLIESTSATTARLAQNSLRGRFSDQVNAINSRIKAIRVQLEAYVDFPEEEISTASTQQLCTRVHNVATELQQLLDSAGRGATLNNGIDIVITGRPNVGKSTLLNALADQDRAIVDATPGTTRDVLSVDVVIDGLLLRVHDTAGLRDSDDAIEREGVRRAKEQIELADAIFCVVTADTDLIDELGDVQNKPVFVIRNKIDQDRLTPVSIPRGKDTYLRLSAKTGEGLDLLRAAVLREFDLAGDVDSTYLARDRHLRALRAALAALQFDVEALLSESPELAAEHLRIASYELGTLTGEFTNDDLLGEIFSTFCIGK